MSKVVEMIDLLCSQTKNPTVLNALHACRPDHPWHDPAGKPFQNACFLVMQHRIEFGSVEVDWLYDAARREATT